MSLTDITPDGIGQRPAQSRQCIDQQASSLYPGATDGARVTSLAIGNGSASAQLMTADTCQMSKTRHGPCVGNNNDDGNQGGDMPSWLFKEESNREETNNRDSKKRPAQLKKNYNHATQDVKVQEGTMEGKCVSGISFNEGQGEEE